MTMFKVNIHEAKAKLSEFIEAVERGEQVETEEHSLNSSHIQKSRMPSSA